MIADINTRNNLDDLKTVELKVRQWSIIKCAIRASINRTKDRIILMEHKTPNNVKLSFVKAHLKKMELILEEINKVPDCWEAEE